MISLGKEYNKLRWNEIIWRITENFFLLFIALIFESSYDLVQKWELISHIPLTKFPDKVFVTLFEFRIISCDIIQKKQFRY